MKGYYFITDSALSRAGNFNDIRAALRAGVKIIQYRDKRADTRELFNEAAKIRKICKRAIFLINDRIDIALAVGADGVHLGSCDLPYPAARKLLGKKRIIGLTVHTVKEARGAEAFGADYIGLSPIFATATKEDSGEPCGLGLIRQVKRSVRIPVVAIGGINLSNASEVIAAGADALCAISAVVTKEDVFKEIKKFQGLFDSFKIRT